MIKMVKIIPQPQEEKLLEGQYTFRQNYMFPAHCYPKAAAYLKSFLSVKAETEDQIRCTIDKGFRREEYILTIDQEISIQARDEEGIFRALSTLRQLAKAGIVPCQRIHDYPSIKNRCVMIDISRGKIPKTERLKDMINILRDVKYNQLQIYIDGLFFEYEHFRNYLQGKEYISIEELAEIKAYCQDNFIELMAVQNCFGHMEKWIELPEFESLGIEREDGKKSDTLNPLDSRSLEMIDKICSDLVPYFDSEYFNIGMDEPFSLGMGQTKEICEQKGKITVYIEYLNQVIRQFNEKHKKTPMFFDDIIFESPESADKIKGNCVVMDWGYEAEAEFAARCEILSRNGLRFYTCPGTSTWGNITGRFDNMIYNIESAAKSCIRYGGEGMMLTDWGDDGNPQFIAASFLPYLFGACCSWNYPVDFFDCAYVKKYDVIRFIEEYADTFIFNGQKVGNLLHRMANYYLLENCNRFNGVNLLWDVWARAEHAVCESEEKKQNIVLNERTAGITKEYMTELRAEAELLQADTPYLDEIKWSCDAIILMEEYVIASEKSSGRINDIVLKERFTELKDRFIRLWLIRSKAAGFDIFASQLDKVIRSFE